MRQNIVADGMLPSRAEAHKYTGRSGKFPDSPKIPNNYHAAGPLRTYSNLVAPNCPGLLLFSLSPGR